MNKVVKQNELEIKIGNMKLGDNTLIFNMTTARDCPSKIKGFCEVVDRCYASKAERLYKNTVPYRERQANYWNSHTATEILADLHDVLTIKKTRLPNGTLVPLKDTIRYFRINEAGDFATQADVEKMNTVSKLMKIAFGVTFYGSTAAKDLDFSEASFLIKGSSGNHGNNGRCIVRKLHTEDTFYEEGGLSYFVCKANCRTCTICKTSNNVNVVFPLH